MSKYAAVRKAHNSQIAPSCHLAIAFDMWWFMLSHGLDRLIQPCPEKDMYLMTPRVSTVVRTQTRYRDVPRGDDNYVAWGWAVLWRRPAGFC